MTDNVRPIIDWSRLPKDEIALVWHVGRIHMKLTVPCKTDEDRNKIIILIKGLELKNTEHTEDHKLFIESIIPEMKKQEHGDWQDEWEDETWLAYACKQNWFTVGPPNMHVLHGVDLDKDSSERYSSLIHKTQYYP